METLLYTATSLTNDNLLTSDYNNLKQRAWGQSELKQLSLKLDQELADVKGMLIEVSAIVLPAALVSSVLSHITDLKTRLLKEGVLKLHPVARTSVSLSKHICVRAAQLYGKINPATQCSVFRVLSMNGMNLS